MLTLSQLLVLTQSERRKFKTKYTIESLKENKGSDNLGDFIQFSSVLTGGKDPRKSTLKVYSDEIDPSSTAKVLCSCPYFRIRLATSLYSMGATELKVAPKEIPEKFQRLQKPGLCPHLFKLVESLLSQNSTEMQRLRQQSPRVSINDQLKRLT